MEIDFMVILLYCESWSGCCGRFRSTGVATHRLDGEFQKNIQEFPLGAQKMIGDELQLIQFGGMPKNAGPFKGVGSGVLEIAVRYETNAFRTVLAVQLGRKIYVLHAFQKKSKRGIATPREHLDLIAQRYRQAKELAKDE